MLYMCRNKLDNSTLSKICTTAICLLFSFDLSIRTLNIILWMLGETKLGPTFYDSGGMKKFFVLFLQTTKRSLKLDNYL